MHVLVSAVLSSANNYRSESLAIAVKADISFKPAESATNGVVATPTSVIFLGCLSYKFRSSPVCREDKKKSAVGTCQARAYVFQLKQK